LYGASRVFHIASGKTVTISGLIITNGRATGTFPFNVGGGISRCFWTRFERPNAFYGRSESDCSD
jgi:hypothetical protein